MDIFSGNIFEVGRQSHRDLGLQKYMRQMEGTGYDLESPIDEPLLPGTDEVDDYHRAMDSLNRIGLSAAGRGIDVRNPDMSNPMAIKASRLWQQRLGDVRRAGNAAAAKKMLFKEYMDGSLKNGVVGPQGVDAANLTAQDVSALRNINPVAKALDQYVDNVNRAAKSYDTAAEADAINQDIGQKRDAIDSWRDSLIGSGYPENEVDRYLAQAKNAIGKATHNDLAERKMEGELDAKNRRISAQNAKDYAAAEKTRQGVNDGESGMPLVKKVIALMRGEGFDGSSSGIGAGNDGPFLTGETLEDMSFTGWRSETGEIPKKVVNNGGETYVEIQSKPDEMGRTSTYTRKLDASFIRDFAPVSIAKGFDEAARDMGVMDEYGNLITDKSTTTGKVKIEGF